MIKYKSKNAQYLGTGTVQNKIVSVETATVICCFHILSHLCLLIYQSTKRYKCY